MASRHERYARLTDSSTRAPGPNDGLVRYNDGWIAFRWNVKRRRWSRSAVDDDRVKRTELGLTPGGEPKDEETAKRLGMPWDAVAQDASDDWIRVVKEHERRMWLKQQSSWLTWLRGQCKLAQWEAAQLCGGMHQSTWSRYERGGHYLSPANAQYIARCLQPYMGGSEGPRSGVRIAHGDTWLEAYGAQGSPVPLRHRGKASAAPEPSSAG